MTELTWGTYVDWLVATHGTLTAVAERLAAERAYEDSVESVERALRRLRARGTGTGGKWGSRALRRFGLPEAVDARMRFMGAYHSPFTDLPVAICEDLIRAWDRPPTTDQRAARVWLQLAWVTIAVRRRRVEDAGRLLRDIPVAGDVPAAAQIEKLLGESFVASRLAPDEGPRWLDLAEPLLAEVADPDDRACLFARWIDHRAYELNHDRGSGTDPAAAERLYLRIPEVGPPFALARRANGLAFCRWRLGRVEEAAADAEAAARHAGDGGHVRLRVMALQMLARIDPSRKDARDRAVAIASRLDDGMLLRRLSRGSRPTPSG